MHNKKIRRWFKISQNPSSLCLVSSMGAKVGRTPLASMLFKKAFSKVLWNSLKFSDFLCFSLIFSLRLNTLGIEERCHRNTKKATDTWINIKYRSLSEGSSYRLLILIIIFAKSLVFETSLFCGHPHPFQFFMGIFRILWQEHLSLLFQLAQPHADFLHVKSLHQSFHFSMHPPALLFF